MSLYDSIYQWSDSFLFLASVLCVAAISLAATAAMWGLGLIWPNRRKGALVTTMLSGILLPTGMVIAFVAADVWKMEERGRAAVEQEATALSDAVRVTRYIEADAATTLRTDIRNYIRAVVDDEWPALGRSGMSQRAEAELEALVVHAVQLEHSSPLISDTIAAQELRKYAARIELARDERLRIAETRVMSQKWTAVLCLLFVSACVLAEMHLADRRMLAVAMALFSVGFGVTIFLISSYDRPFTGKTSIRPAPIEHVLDKMHEDNGSVRPLGTSP